MIDWLRPPSDRTHAGRFVQAVLDGQSWGIVGRKAGYALASLGGGPLAWITTAVLILAVLVLTRPGRYSPLYLDAAVRQWPMLRPTLAAVVATSVIGAVVNDYGIRVVTFAFVALLPLVAVSCVRATEAPAKQAASGSAKLPG